MVGNRCSRRTQSRIWAIRAPDGSFAQFPVAYRRPVHARARKPPDLGKKRLCYMAGRGDLLLNRHAVSATGPHIPCKPCCDNVPRMGASAVLAVSVVQLLARSPCQRSLLSVPTTRRNDSSAFRRQRLLLNRKDSFNAGQAAHSVNLSGISTLYENPQVRQKPSEEHTASRIRHSCSNIAGRGPLFLRFRLRSEARGHVVICAGTTDFNLTMSPLSLIALQKRFRYHFAT